ncbi:hypothetical protein [Oceanirhabdus sp. W0125-5]|uniref:hypothetical protein n=1 Tax=Oceanirhabdus sp. W0125-5 TaxID=2999116 RepID=UPI0022F2D39B|nr:hypothetical protein [Oceanirhabdus sp. W0125-5]WBW94706.1 hypothetical protein OW730_13475 [Oceanirhabdus sp. W0125-5]
MDKYSRKGISMLIFQGILACIVVICTSYLWFFMMRKPRFDQDFEEVRFKTNFLGNRFGVFLRYIFFILLLVIIGLIVNSIITKEYHQIFSIINFSALYFFNMLTCCSEYIITTEGVGKSVLGRKIVFYHWKDIIIFKPVGKKKIYFEVIDEKGIKREFNQYFMKRDFQERVEYLNEHVLIDRK